MATGLLNHRRIPARVKLLAGWRIYNPKENLRSMSRPIKYIRLNLIYFFLSNQVCSARMKFQGRGTNLEKPSRNRTRCSVIAMCTVQQGISGNVILSPPLEFESLSYWFAKVTRWIDSPLNHGIIHQLNHHMASSWDGMTTHNCAPIFGTHL